MMLGNKYYLKRKPQREINFEESYWGTVKDPDGIVRDRSTEREKFLANVTQELDFINALPIGRVLDMGCGMGFFLSGIRKGWKKHGVEISSYAADYAKHWGEIFVGALHQATFPDGYFDLIVMHHVIEHIETPEDTLIETHRILAENGHLIMATPDFDSGCARHFGDNYRLLHDNTHISLFTNESMHRFLRDHDFIIDRVEYPFFDTPYFTKENLLRLFDTTKISPPFYGSFMTFYCHKPPQNSIHKVAVNLSKQINSVDQLFGVEVAQLATFIKETVGRGNQVTIWENGESKMVKNLLNGFLQNESTLHKFVFIDGLKDFCVEKTKQTNEQKQDENAFHGQPILLLIVKDRNIRDSEVQILSSINRKHNYVVAINFSGCEVDLLKHHNLISLPPKTQSGPVITILVFFQILSELIQN